MTELEKDMREILNAFLANKMDIGLGDLVTHAAERLDELGYVKVVRCGECKHWGGNREHVHECPVCAGWLEKGMALCYGRFIENIDGVLMKADEFCPEGERVEKEGKE